MKYFLDLTGLTQFLAKLKTIFTEEIKSDYVAPQEGETGYDESYEDTPSGGFTYMTRDSSGNLTVPHNVTVKNVVTTDETQTISGDKTFTGTVKVPNIAEGATDTGLAANKGYVDSKITENDAMSYKGAVYPNSDVTEGHAHLPFTGTTKTQYKVGATFKTAAEGTYYTAEGGGEGKQQVARIGDLFIVKTVASTSPYTLTYDYIPAADDVTSVQYSADGTGINVGTSATYGQAIFGEAAIKPVDTSVSAGSSSTNLPTSQAVATYAISGVTAGDNSVTIGTKTGGTQSVAVKVKADSGITSDTNGIYAVADTNNGISIDANGIGVIVNTNSGLSMDATNGVTLTTPGNGIEVDSTSHNIKAVGNSVKGIEITGSGISAKLNGTNGLKFDSNGKISLDLGNGLAETATGNKLEVKIDSTNANGLSTSSDGIALALATPSTNNVGGTNGAMSAQDKEKLDNLDPACAKKLDVAAGANNTVDLQLKDGQGTAAVLDTVNISSTNKAIGVGVGTASGSTTKLEITANVDTATGLQIDSTNGIQINNGNGTQFNGTSGAIEVKAYDGITVDANGVSADIDTTDGLEFTGSTAGSKKIGVKANSTKGIESTSNGVGVVVLTNSGLSFDNTTGGQENGALYIETIPLTGENSIESLFV